jgi:hypothetical protein
VSSKTSNRRACTAGAVSARSQMRQTPPLTVPVPVLRSHRQAVLNPAGGRRGPGAAGAPARPGHAAAGQVLRHRRWHSAPRRQDLSDCCLPAVLLNMCGNARDVCNVRHEQSFGACMRDMRCLLNWDGQAHSAALVNHTISAFAHQAPCSAANTRFTAGADCNSLAALQCSSPRTAYWQRKHEPCA